jgi:hypothetical protein
LAFGAARPTSTSRVWAAASAGEGLAAHLVAQFAPQQGQRTRWVRCSVTITLVGGSSATWWRPKRCEETRSPVANSFPHPRQQSG